MQISAAVANIISLAQRRWLRRAVGCVAASREQQAVIKALCVFVGTNSQGLQPLHYLSGSSQRRPCSDHAAEPGKYSGSQRV